MCKIYMTEGHCKEHNNGNAHAVLMDDTCFFIPELQFPEEIMNSETLNNGTRLAIGFWKDLILIVEYEAGIINIPISNKFYHKRNSAKAQRCYDLARKTTKPAPAIRSITKLTPDEMDNLQWKLQELETLISSMHSGNLAHKKGNVRQAIWSIRKDLGLPEEACT